MIQNPLANGRYEFSCWVTSHEESGRLAVQELRLFEFVVFGAKLIVGAVDVESDLEAVVVEREEDS